MSKKFCGFTLSEILITLGVIGVVAAMTLPTVIKNYQKTVLINKLKKSYTIMSQAYIRSFEENGNYLEEYETLSQAEIFNKYWKPYLKNVTFCDNTTDYRCGYSINVFYSLNKQYNIALPSSKYVSDRMMFILPDGIAVEIINNTTIIDINGPSGPNLYGKDVFYFVMDSGKFMPNGHNNNYTTVNNSCKTTGYCCSYKIIMDGWKIKNDYPW